MKGKWQRIIHPVAGLVTDLYETLSDFCVVRFPAGPCYFPLIRQPLP